MTPKEKQLKAEQLLKVEQLLKPNESCIFIGIDPAFNTHLTVYGFAVLYLNAHGIIVEDIKS